jgi:16S rRNA (cytidine1402-2'-O)-methyltransferase
LAFFLARSLRFTVRFDIGCNLNGYRVGRAKRGEVVDDVDATVPGELVIVATPLGNLGDLSARALALLAGADVVFCEDTRHSRALFSAHAITPRHRLRSLHEHNEASLAREVVALVDSGRQVVVISDAGTPGISDPGARVVAAVADAGLRVTTAPGPSAVIAALSISGLPTERFVMEGFVPRKAGERATLLERWAREDRTIVAFESPQRVAATLAELAQRFPERRVAVAREMTKVHEEVVRGTAREVADRLGSAPVRGEVVVVVAGAPNQEVDDEPVRGMLRSRLASGVSMRDAVAEVSESLGVAHRRVYRIALELRSDADG